MCACPLQASPCPPALSAAAASAAIRSRSADPSSMLMLLRAELWVRRACECWLTLVRSWRAVSRTVMALRGDRVLSGQAYMGSSKCL